MLKKLLLISLLISSSVLAEGIDKVRENMDKVYGEHEKHEAFFHEFRNAVIAVDMDKVATLMNYPFNWYSPDGKRSVGTKEQFLDLYQNLFTSHIYQVVHAQAFEELHFKDTGVWFGFGEIWFSGLCNDDECKDLRVKVVSINTKI